MFIQIAVPIKYIWNAIKIEASELKKGTFNVSVMTWIFFLFFKYLKLLYQITYIFKPNVKIVFKLNRWNIYTIENYHALEPFWVWGSDKKCMKDWSLTNNKWILKFQKKKSLIIFLQITAVLSKKKILILSIYRATTAQKPWIYHFVIVLL